MGLLNNLGGAFGFGGGGGKNAALPAELTANSGNTTPAAGLEPGNGWVYHTFTGPGSFTVNKEGLAQVFAIGGGGAGCGHAAGGGGGAGGLVYDTAATFTTGTYNVTRGGGGAGSGDTSSGSAQQGASSEISGPGGTWTGYGGGRGGGYSTGGVGGCGGGNGGWPETVNDQPHTPANQQTSPNPASSHNFGMFGGSSQDNGNHAGAGGGGIGARGRDAPNNNNAGQGGPGIQFDAFRGPIIGVPGLNPFNGGFGGGGGGGGWNGENGSPGGSYGGGAGRISYSNTNAVAGTDYTGGGGGSGNGPNSNGGAGGVGLVVVRYRKEVLQGGDGTSSSNPIRYASDMNKIGTSGNYWIQTRSMGDAVQFYVDTTINDGPWIRAYVAASDTNSTDVTWGSQHIPGLLASSNMFMYCFVNVNDNSTTQEWSWWFYNGFDDPHYSEFIGNPPQRHGSVAEPLITRTNCRQLSSGTDYAGYYLRTGISSFGSFCDNSRSGTWGMICMKNNNTDGSTGPNDSSAGLSDFPMHTGFATSTSDYCAQSNQNYTTTSCSSTRRFAMYCKLFDQEFGEPELP